MVFQERVKPSDTKHPGWTRVATATTATTTMATATTTATTTHPQQPTHNNHNNNHNRNINANNNTNRNNKRTNQSTRTPQTHHLHKTIAGKTSHTHRNSTNDATTRQHRTRHRNKAKRKTTSQTTPTNCQRVCNPTPMRDVPNTWEPQTTIHPYHKQQQKKPTLNVDPSSIANATNNNNNNNNNFSTFEIGRCNTECRGQTH